MPKFLNKHEGSGVIDLAKIYNKLSNDDLESKDARQTAVSDKRGSFRNFDFETMDAMALKICRMLRQNAVPKAPTKDPSETIVTMDVRTPRAG